MVILMQMSIFEGIFPSVNLISQGGGGQWSVVHDIQEGVKRDAAVCISVNNELGPGKK